MPHRPAGSSLTRAWPNRFQTAYKHSLPRACAPRPRRVGNHGERDEHEWERSELSAPQPARRFSPGRARARRRPEWSTRHRRRSAVPAPRGREGFRDLRRQRRRGGVLPVPVVQAHSKATHRRVIVGVDFVVQEGAAAAHAETRIEGEEQQGAGHGPWTAPARRLRVLAVHRRQQHQVCRMSISMSMAVSMTSGLSS